MKNLLTLFVLCFTIHVSAQEIHSDFEIQPIEGSVEQEQNVVSRNINLKSSTCSNVSSGTISLVNCTDIGTANYNTQSITSIVDFSPGAIIPSPLPSCWVGDEFVGNWSVYDLATGVSSISVIPTSLAVASLATYVRMAFYQGTDCNNLTEIACEYVVVNNSGWAFLDPVIVGLNDSQQLWVFTTCDDLYNLDVELRGYTTPTNSSCSTASISSVGCNAGATGQTSWLGPNNNGVTCTGGTWYSNENTVFYTFQATQNNATIEVQGLICNDGTNGEAQFAVWENCADVGNYTSGFLGCAVGAGTLSLPALTIGQTYIIVVDGQAGDVCSWNFISTGTNLPVEFISLNATSMNGYNEITWSTATEMNADYFSVEKSVDGISFFEIGFVDAIGNSQERIDYSFVDDEQERQTVYYRLRQVDLDGEFVYQGPVFLDYSADESLTFVPNPVENIGEINYFFKAKKEYLIEVRGVNGRILLADYLNPQNNVFSYPILTDQLAKGLYFVSITSENGEVITSNFMKK